MAENKNKKYMSKSEIIEKLLTYIIDNDLQAGEKMPAERTLCDLWNANRSTLRSSLHRLVEDGYLEAMHGKGYFVSKKKIIRNLQDMKSLNIVVEEQGRKLKTKVVRQEVISGNIDLAEIFQINIDDPVLELVRMRYIDDQAASLEYNYADLTRLEGLENVDFSSVPYYTVLEIRYDLTPHSGFQEISITNFREEEAVLFGKEESEPALYMSGLTYDKNDKDIPIEVFKSITDPKLFSLASHMKVFNS